MLHLDAILSLYPDQATQRLLLSQALTHTRHDLIALRDAIDTRDHTAALQHAHRAKGTASFLGADQQALRQFDQLTHALRNPDDEKTGAIIHLTTITATDHAEPSTCIAASHTVPANIALAFNAIASVLQELEISLQTLLRELENIAADPGAD